MPDNRATLRALVGAVLLGLLLAPAHAAEDPFPLYPIITPNVAFWTAIYSRYGTNQAVVHDSQRLDIVYDLIDLEPADQPGARKTNRRRMQQASRHFAAILNRLAKDPQSPDPACRQVAALFGDRADARSFAHARHRVRCQIGQRDRFREGLIRSGAYLEQMRAILLSEGVPADLAYLPHVESSFNTDAYSKFGAAGMWQFTRSTGRRFLTVDYVIDERRDPIAATHAAARLLKENYAKLGSWPLAITAYNHGAAGMQRAKAAHGDYPAIFDAYRGRTFKFASRNFYAEFLAARQVAADYRRYFGELELKRPEPSTRVRLDGYADFADLCRHFDVSPQIMRAMNPALRPPVFSGQKLVPAGYRLHLPPGIESHRMALTDAQPGLFKPAQKRSRFYTVQRGDTAGKIARMHHVGLSDLILANDLDRRATVYVRQTLRIPLPGETTPEEPERPPQEKADDKVLTASAAAQPLPALGPGRSYRRPGPAPADLLAPVSAGVAMKPRDTVARTSVPPSAAASIGGGFSRIVEIDRQRVGILEVDVEETLGHYAEWAGVRAAQIRHLNRLPFGRPLQLHQQIKIPLNAVSADGFQSRRDAYHRQLQQDFFAAYRVGDLQRYRVQPGDNYWKLCREKFDLPLWLLKHYNRQANLAALKIHQRLTIPSVESLAGSDPGTVDGAGTPDA